jgi:hypothetical protein
LLARIPSNEIDFVVFNSVDEATAAKIEEEEELASQAVFLKTYLDYSPFALQPTPKPATVISVDCHPRCCSVVTMSRRKTAPGDIDFIGIELSPSFQAPKKSA